MKNKAGFTLAEVLITLGIIGVVAAMTIPTLMQNTNEKEKISQLKKVYTNLSNAYKLATVYHGKPSTWTSEKTPEQTDLFLDNIVSNMKVIQRCKVGETGCFEGYYKSLTGTERADILVSGHSRVVLSDGSFVGFFLNSPQCQYMGSGSSAGVNKKGICGGLIVDVNGKKGPNIAGKDIFTFFAMEDEILPAGTQDDNTEFAFSKLCSRNSTNANQSGQGCTAWVIFNDNMDYLKCDDLSWDGKRQCD